MQRIGRLLIRDVQRNPGKRRRGHIHRDQVSREPLDTSGPRLKATVERQGSQAR